MGRKIPEGHESKVWMPTVQSVLQMSIEYPVHYLMQSKIC